MRNQRLGGVVLLVVARVFAATLLVLLGLTGCTGGEGASQHWDDFGEPPWTGGIEVGKTYEYSVNPHCGIEQAQIDGTGWRAEPPLSDGQGNPPEWWSGSTIGELRIIDEDTAVFRNDDGHEAIFVRDDLPGVACL